MNIQVDQVPMSTKEGIPALTGIRSLASFWVVFHHLQPEIAMLSLTPLVGDLARGGERAVDLFFVLSGFILSLNYHKQFRKFKYGSYLQFLWLRLARIYPVHIAGLAVWALLLLVSLLVGRLEPISGGFSFANLVANLLLIQGWSVPMRNGWNYPAWSISMEWLAYLWFPFLVGWISAVRKMALMVGGLVVLLVITGPLVVRYPTASSFIRIGCEFVTGCILWSVWRRIRWAGTWSLGWITLPSVVMAIALSNIFGWYSIPVFGLVVLSLALDKGAGSQLFGSRLFVYWGKVSYSLYIMHAAVISICRAALPVARYQGTSLAERFVVLLAYLLCIAGAGSFTYHFVEEPLRLWMRSRNPGYLRALTDRSENDVPMACGAPITEDARTEG